MTAARRFKFNDDFTPDYGACVRLSDTVRRVTAHNPGPFARWGTNTFLVGAEDQLALIDPGPDTEAHFEAIQEAVGAAQITAIFVSHEHPDHSPLAWRLSAAHGAQIVMGRPTGGGRPAVEASAAAAPTIVTAEAEGVFQGPDWRIETRCTPGHARGHLCFAFPQEGALFSGDHVMAWAMPHISPPEGDMDAYLDSLDRVIEAAYAHMYPAHGPDVGEPEALLDTCKRHRLAREQQVLEAIARGPIAVAGVVEDIYAGLEAELRPAAGQTVLAHLLRLERQGLALRVGAQWRAA